MIRIEPDGDRFAIRASAYSRILYQVCRSTPGMRWEDNAWRGYPDAIEVVQRRCAQYRTTVVGKVPEPGAPKISPFSPSLAGLYEYQREAVLTGLAHADDGFLLGLDVGLGKAQPIDEPVLTPTGWRPIGELRPGDQVLGSDGRPTRVLSVHPQGRKEVFRVSFASGASTRCCANHLWSVYTPNDRVRGKPARVLSLKDIVAAGLYRKHAKNWFVPVAGVAQFAKQPRMKLEPYLVGALIANGSLTATSIGHSGGDDQRKLMPLPPACMWGNSQDGVHAGIIPSTRGEPNVVRDELARLKLVGTVSETKFVPPPYLTASPEDRLAMLQGLMDNDGTVGADGMVIEYNTVSRQLAEDVAFLARSLGAVTRTSTRIPTFVYKGVRKNGQRDYRVRLSMPADTVPFRLPRKVARFKPRTKYPPANAIAAVEPCGTAACTCIRVAAKDQLYVTNDFIVTHNTVCAFRVLRAIAKYASEGRPASFVVICPAFVTGTWQDEAVKWKWKGDVVVLKGTKIAPETKLRPQRHTIYVVNASIVHAWVDKLLETNPIGLVIDEIHMFQGDAEKSRRTAAVLQLREQCRYAIGLTGTPDPNRIKSLYPIFNILSPGRFGPNIYEFGRRYCAGTREEVAPGKVVWKFDGVSNEEELKRRLEFCLFRRTKAEVASELPPLTRQITPIDVGKSKRKATGLILNGKVNKKALRSELAMAGVAKIPAVVEMVEADVKAGSSVVVGTYRRAVAEEIGAKLAHLDAIVVHGELTTERRKKLIATQPKVLVATIDSVGVGINTLTYASVGIVAEMTYEPWELAQFEGRFHRRGQHSPVLIRYPIARGSIDEHVRDVVLTKMKLSEKPIGTAGDKMVDDFGATVSVDKVLDDLCERLMKEDE